MRIFCLTSIILREDPPPNFVEPSPYDNGADKSIVLETEEQLALRNLKIYGSCHFYMLTEICIGFIERGERKKYVMNIYREDIGLLVIPMVQSMVHLNEISKDSIEIYIPLRYFYGNMTDWDLEIKIRCFKNTSIKGFISKEEESIYSSYANLINGYNFEDREKAFKTHLLQLPNPSGDNVLRTKLSDFRTLIDLLCHPETGSYKNVPKDKRYNQKAKCLLNRNNRWNTEAPRKGELQKQSKNYHFCKELVWTNVDLNVITSKDINPNIVETIQFKHVILHNFVLKLHPCLTELFFPNLSTLSLTHCNITEISDDYANLFQPSLRVLDLSNNNIIFITKEISKAVDLKTLILSDNINLNENGIPWEYLPPSIINFQLKETNISVIPESIKRLECLQVLKLHSKNLRHVSWENISPTIIFLDIKGGGFEINEINLKNKCNMLDLNVMNVGLMECNTFKISPTIQRLNLNNNKLKYFDTNEVLPFLRGLSLNNNILDSINWKHLPQYLEYLYINENNLKSIQDISHLSNLSEFVATANQIEYISDDIGKHKLLKIVNLENNCLSSLPEGFEYLTMLKELNLTKNKFNFAEINLEEVLWKRLPKNLKILWLNENNLFSLPCILKNAKIQYLNVENCNLRYICPFLYANFRESYTLFLNINNNPQISILPFIPQYIFQPPAYNEKLMTECLEETDFVLIKNLPENSEDLKKFIITSKFPTKSKKPVYGFMPYIGNEKSVNCNCCGNCGNYTNNNLIQQLMVMDFPLKFEYTLPVQKILSTNSSTKKKKVETSSNLLKNESEAYTKSDEDTSESDINQMSNKKKHKEKQYKYYQPGKWKTNVITKICDKCITAIKEDTDEAYEEFLQSQRKNVEHQQIVNGFQQEIPQMIQTDTYETENVTALLQNVNFNPEEQSSAANFALNQNTIPYENLNTDFVSQEFENFSAERYYFPPNQYFDNRVARNFRFVSYFAKFRRFFQFRFVSHFAKLSRKFRQKRCVKFEKKTKKL